LYVVVPSSMTRRLPCFSVILPCGFSTFSMTSW
jgi:hypothetical protein